MSRTCEFCGGDVYELARARNHVWSDAVTVSSRREDIDAASVKTMEEGPTIRANARFHESPVGRYVIAATAIAVAFAIRLALKPLIGNASPFLLFTPAVMVAAWYGHRPRSPCQGGRGPRAGLVHRETLRGTSRRLESGDQ